MCVKTTAKINRFTVLHDQGRIPIYFMSASKALNIRREYVGVINQFSKKNNFNYITKDYLPNAVNNATTPGIEVPAPFVAVHIY